VEGSNVERKTHGIDVEEAPLARIRETSSAATEGFDVEWAPLAT